MPATVGEFEVLNTPSPFSLTLPLSRWKRETGVAASSSSAPRAAPAAVKDSPSHSRRGIGQEERILAPDRQPGPKPVADERAYSAATVVQAVSPNFDWKRSRRRSAASRVAVRAKVVEPLPDISTAGAPLARRNS